MQENTLMLLAQRRLFIQDNQLEAQKSVENTRILRPLKAIEVEKLLKQQLIVLRPPLPTSRVAFRTNFVYPGTT